MNGSDLSSRTTDESEAERNNRNLSDLLQELRVAGLGVQVLFGFLLGLPFTVRFSQLDGSGRALYQVSLVCAAIATALLVSPVAYHRWVFRRHEKGRLLRYANVQAILGLAHGGCGGVCGRVDGLALRRFELARGAPGRHRDRKLRGTVVLLPIVHRLGADH